MKHTSPIGERHFPTAAAAKDAALARVGKDGSFVVIQQPPAEFAWISPADAFVQRSLPAMLAGIFLVERVN